MNIKLMDTLVAKEKRLQLQTNSNLTISYISETR